MKSIRWIGWVALVALFVVPLAAAPAWAAPNFTGSPLVGVVPMNVTFTPTGVTGTPDSVHWDFGDAVTAMTLTPVAVTHVYSTGPTTFTVGMHVWYGVTDSSVIKGAYVETVPAQIVVDSVDKAPCGGVLNQNLPDTVHFRAFAPPSDSVWWIIKDTTTGGTFIDSVRTTGSNKFKLDYVFTVPDTFLVTAKPFAADSLLTADTSVYVYITSACYCVQAVLDGYSMNENDTLRAFILDNDTLGNKNQPRPVDSVRIQTLKNPFNSDVLDTAYFDTTTTGIWRLVYIPQSNWHGKDTLTYEVFVQDGCTPGVATVAITVYSNFRVDIDSLWYVHNNSSNCGGCDAQPNTINLGDSIQIWVRLNPVDVQELAPGWPKAFFAGMGGSAGGDVMFQDTTGYYGNDSIYFSIPFMDTAGAYPDWRAVLSGGIDVAPYFYPIIAQALSDSNKLAAETTIVAQAIDTKGPIVPPLEVTFTEESDSLNNGVVGMGDWLKFYIDLRNNPIINNPPGKKEICDVYVLIDTLWGLNQPGVDSRIFVQLYDSANDNRFKGFYRVDAGRLQAPANSQTARFFITDNGCNLDTSVFATLAPPVDNVAPMLDSAVIVYQELLDRDSTNCLGVGASDPLADSVLLRVTVPAGQAGDIAFLYADLLRAGIGGTNTAQSVRYPLVNKGGGVWELRWLLKTNTKDSVWHPYDLDSISPTYDGAAAGDSIEIFAVDISGNGDTKWSGPLTSLIPGASPFLLDTRVPKPVTGLWCERDTTAAGTPQFKLQWLTQDDDAEKFLIFWNKGCGDVVYNETLAVAFAYRLGEGDTAYQWVTDSTVKPISPCRNYKFNVWTVDNCNNVERVHPTPTTCGITVSPVVNLDATNSEAGEITLTWTGTDSSAAKYYIYWDAGSGTINYNTKLDSVIGGPGYQTWDSTNCSLFRPGFAGDSIYKFAVRTVDSCTVNTPSCPNIDAVGATDTAMVRHIKPVGSLTCQSIAGGAIQLRWTSPEDTKWLGTMVIHYGKDSANAIDWSYNIDTISWHQADVWVADSGFYRWNTTMANPVPPMVEHGGYVFTVESVDKCGVSEVQHATPTFCYSDKAPAYACVIQPEPGSLYCDNTYHGLTIYTCARDSASNDIKTVTAWGRLKDISPAAGNQPGDWFTLGGSSLSEPGVCFHINLDPLMLNYQVGADTVQTVEVAIATTDVVGKTITPDEAWAACATQYWFDWSTRVIAGNLLTINGQQRVLQTFCGTRGYQLYGATNPVAISVTGGTPPYALQVIVDGNEYLYQERVNNSITFNLDATGFGKGGHYMQVFWSDSCGWTGSDADSLCVPDSIPPCALVVNPVDGKCIRRAMSMRDPIGQYEDPITIHIEGNDLTPGGQYCVDQSGVLKVDFQWSQDCCVGDLVDTTWVNTWYNCDDTLGNGDNLKCDTLFNFYGPGRHQITCRDTTMTPTCSTNVWTMVVDSVPCETIYEWHTFAIDSANGTDTYTAKWFNHDDLAWITQSGTNIYLRGVVYDKSGNIFYTPCVQVCIDIDTPPICIRTENLCPDGRLKGFAKILAEIDWAEGNTDDIEDVYLYTKKHSDPDLFGFWTSQGVGLPATNSTMWTWDMDFTSFEDQTYYDFRVIAKTTWGTWSYDLDGNQQFDAGTFDETNCDAKTWLIDNTAPKIAIDTAWTMINDHELVIPNTGCRVSDPKGYVWTQYGNTITVQPTIYPLGDMGDVVKTQWTLYDGEGIDGASCPCDGSQSEFDAGDGAASYVFGVFEGSHAMDKLVFDPTDAPFVGVTTGYQKHVLHVKAWDGCGNTSEDCIEVYLLDIDTTEAILISPVNDSVFCDKMSADGGIRLTAATLLSNEMKKAVFAYRAKGTTDWTVIDSVEIPPVQAMVLDGGTISIVWYPKAAGLADGDYELTVWATDGALNHQMGDGYPITIHLSCAVPTVAMVYPQTGDPAFIGCPIEVVASASSSDPGNPIVEVNFYIQSIMNTTVWFIGSDNFTVDGLWSVSWDPHSTYWKSKLSDGQYYMWAEAKNRAGLITKTVLKDVVVRYDETDPHSEIIQVNGDRSDGGATDPTIVESGQTVPLYVLSADDLSPAGYGLTDNSGLDSVMIYVTEDESIGGKVVFGALMTPVDSLSGLYVVEWPTTGLERGLYHVTAVAIDQACNTSSCECDWLVRIVNPTPSATIGVTEGLDYCGASNIKEGPIHLTLTPASNEAIKAVEFWRSSLSSSDVWDQWSFVGVTTVAEDGIFTFEVSAESVAVWSEGSFRLRAFYQSTDNTWIDDGNHDGKFDDFTFDPAHKTWQMLLNVDRSVTPFTVALSPSMTLRAGRQVKVTVTPEEECDVDQICYGAVAENGNYGLAKDGCVDSLNFSFNPIDSGLVSLYHGVWNGSIRTTVSDPLGNSDVVDVPLWILELTDTNQVRVVDWSPRSHVVEGTLEGDYVYGVGDTLATLTARKLTWTNLDSVVFYQSQTATGAGERIGKAAKTTGSDEFSVNWNIKNVSEGDRYVWGVSWRGTSSFNNAPRTWVIITKTPANIVLRDPIPHTLRTDGPNEVMFVGGRVDLCLNRDSISSIVNGVGIDSVVFGYRFGNAPGGPVPDKLDPTEGWVRINSDRYGSLCVDWFACDTLAETCEDGRYALVAWVYDKAGHVNHSNIVHVMVDCTDPYSEIVDIDGDETFGDCHDITLTGNDTEVKFMANAIDNASCAGSTAAFNSGAKYLQFFVGQCGEGSGGGADIVFVIDGSGSMGDDQTALANNTAAFAQAMAGYDINYGVLGYGTEQKLINLDGSQVDGSPGIGQFTKDPAVLATMVTSVGTGFGGSEAGLTALSDALIWYPWRSGIKKVLVLVTDEMAADIADIGTLQPGLIASGAQINTILNFADSVGYSALAPATQGLMLDLTGNWGSNLAALAEQIKAVAGSGTGNDVGIVWGQQVVLTDGQDDAFALWNPRGLKTGNYCAWTVVIDEVGNSYTSIPRSLCIYDKTPPVAWVAGFGTSTDTSNAHSFDHEYAIYGRSADTDIDHVQFQYRSSSSTSETDWTGIGISRKVNGDSTLWMADWNPCLRSGNFDFRVVPTDKSGNENFEMQPILKVTLDGACGITLPDGPPSSFEITLEDRAFANLGLVNVDGVTTHPTSMIAVYADLNDGLAVEKVNLRIDVGDHSHLMGSFDDSSILNGGIGWFWAVYNNFTTKRTYLKKADLNVYLVDNLGLPGTLTNASTGTKVTLQPEALTSTNGVVIYPARVPTVWLDQQHMVAWPTSSGGMLTAIRLTDDEYGFNIGRYAEIEISYDRAQTQAAGIDDDELSIAWWDGDRWNTDEDIIALPGKPIANGKAYFATRDLHGVYAVVSAGGILNKGAVDVSIMLDKFWPYVDGTTNPWPVMRAMVRSKLNKEFANSDIDEDKIIVVLDGVTIYTDGSEADDWDGWWDEISGQLEIAPDPQPGCGDYNIYPDGGSAKPVIFPGLATGSHWIKVQAFNRQGFWNFDSTTFDVDASRPVVAAEDTVQGVVCPNGKFNLRITDAGSGVNWDSVFVDVHDFTASYADEYPLSRLIETVGPDDIHHGTDGNIWFTLNASLAEMRRVKIVVYDGIRSFVDECGCVRYDHICDGVPDLVGNHTSITEVTYTVDASGCTGTGTGEVTVIGTGSSRNPFDPWAGEFVGMTLNGFGSGGGYVTANVYDLTGEKVKSLNIGTSASVTWDGSTDESEDKVAEGVYLVHFQHIGGRTSGSTSQVVKVVVKRK